MNAYSYNGNNDCFFKDKLQDVLCDGNHRELKDLLAEPFTNTSDYKSELEYILLRSGLYQLSPLNLKEHKICDVHYNHLIKKPRRNHCNTCKTIFGHTFYSTSDLRHIPPVIAYGVWQDYQISLFDQIMCGSCRKKLEKKYVTKDLYEKSQGIFSWLYDGYTLFTPSTNSSTPSMYEFNEQEEMKPQPKRDFKRFLLNIGYNGRIEMTNNYNQMKYKSQNNFLRQVKLILLFILQILAPNDFRHIWYDIIQAEIHETNQKYKSNEQFGIVMKCIADAYNHADHWSTRRQILSIVAHDVPFFIIEQFIPDVTDWRIKAARKQAYGAGRGTVVNIDRALTVRYKDEQIAHFIQYIVSPHITTDLPFGERRINLSSGDTIIVPNTIRNLIPSRIIDAYKQFCKESDADFQPLSDTCLFEILNECSASKRKSLQGLDYFAADGANAFDVLQNLCDELAAFGIAAARVIQLKNGLNQSRNYLKNDFKLHVQNSSEVADHCSTYGLSDASDRDWQEECDHFHHLECDQCLMLKNTLKDIRLTLEVCNIKDERRTRYLYRFDQNVQLIWDWKAHLMRCIRQDLAKTDILESLQRDSVIILLDWAMKWLPMKYREAQRDFFAKRGLPWHITYVIQAQKIPLTSSSSESASNSSSKRLFQHQTFLHAFDQCTQNGRAVTSILVDVFQRLKKHDPDIKYAYLRADNAGCYHGAETLLSIEQIFKQSGVLIRRFDFSDPQGGKSACDRMAAVVKCNVRRHMNEKNNVENSQQFVEATKATKYLSAYASMIVPYLSTNKVSSSTKKPDWSGVTMFNNIEYKLNTNVSENNHNKLQKSSHVHDEIEVTTWRSYKIGKGKTFLWSNLNTLKNTDQLVVTHELSQSKDKWMNEKTKEQNDEYQSDSDAEANDGEADQEHAVAKDSSGFLVFDCPDVNCIRQFRRYSNLQIHLATGEHKYPPVKLTLLDKAKLFYQQSLENDQTNHVPSIEDFTIIHGSDTHGNGKLKQGWALFSRKPQIPFSQEQLAFLNAKYTEGERNGLKWDPSVVSEQMATAMTNNEYIFEPSQCLSPNQIKSYFGRVTRKRRQQSQIPLPRTTDEQESEISDDDNESLHFAELMQSSIDALKTKRTAKHEPQQLSTSSPSTVRKLDSRSKDDLTKQQPSKRLSKNK